MDPSTNPPGSPSGPSPASPFGPPRQADWLPRCSVCGRQDETLRVVSYPYVVSLLVVTFRRAFSGLYCATHRAPWAILAGLITATVGWLGIPFGFIFTPVTLFQLVRGGEQPAAPNLRLLKALAEHKLQKGDAAGAARCLEACLQFGDDEAISERLRAVYGGSLSLRVSAGGFRALPIILLLPGAALAGIIASIVNYLIASRIAPLFGEETSIYGAILGWAPLLAMSFVAMLLLGWMTEWALSRARCRQAALGVAVAICAAALTTYGVPEGKAIFSYVTSLRAGIGLTSMSDALVTTAAVLTRGGALQILDAAGAGKAWGIIYIAIMLALAVGSLGGAVSAALRTVGWQRRIGAVRRESSAVPAGSHIVGWAVLATATVGLVLYAASLPQHGLVDYLEALDHSDRSILLWQQGQGSQALAECQEIVAHRPDWTGGHLLLGQMYNARGLSGAAEEQFREVLRLDADSAEAHTGLGKVYYERSSYQAAIGEFRLALALAPGDSSSHLDLGMAYYGQGSMDRAVEELRQAVRLDAENSTAALFLGMAQASKAEFGQAIEQLKALAKAKPRWAAPHAALAVVYYRTDQPTQLLQETRLAEACQPLDDLDSRCLAALYGEQSQFAKAEAVLKKAREQSPAPTYLLIALAAAYSAQGRFDLAHQACDQALQLRPGLVAARLARADAYYTEGRFDLALQELLQAQQSAPEEWLVYSDLSFVYLHLGQADRALEQAEEAVRLAPYSAYAHTELAFACQALGLGERAFAAAQEAVRLRPKGDRPHYILGLCYAERGEKEQARAEFEAFLKYYWDRPYAREYKAQAEAYLAGS